MVKDRLLRAALVGLLIASACQNAAAQRAGYIIGVGGLSCGKYLEHRQQNYAPQTDLYVNWTWGYLSAYNHFAAQQQVLPPDDPPSILAYLDKYCRDHPLDKIINGAVALIGDLGGMKQAPKKSR